MNPDHEIIINDSDPQNKRKWKVIKGRKTIDEIILEEINSSLRKPPMTPTEKTRLRNKYNL